MSVTAPGIDESEGQMMSGNRRSMHVRLDPEQTRRLLDWARGHASAEAEADSEPSGYTLVIGIGNQAYGYAAEARWGNDTLELGHASVEMVEEP